jgi:hypothetical protein
VGEDGGVQALQRLPGVDAELACEQVPGSPVSGQRLGLPPGPVQGQRQLPVQPLPQRVLGGQLFQFAGELVVPADCQRLLAMLLDDPPGALRHDRRRAGHPHRQHRPHPRPLPGQAAPSPRHHRPGQCRAKQTRETGLPGAPQRCYDNDQQTTKAASHI